MRFRFKQPNRELPLTVGSIPIFSRAWGRLPDGKPKRFDEIVTDIPIGSGPYRIGTVKFGRDITYERDTTYWGHDLNAVSYTHLDVYKRQGMYTSPIYLYPPIIKSHYLYRKGGTRTI